MNLPIFCVSRRRRCLEAENSNMIHGFGIVLCNLLLFKLFFLFHRTRKAIIFTHTCNSTIFYPYMMDADKNHSIEIYFVFFN